MTNKLEDSVNNEVGDEVQGKSEKKLIKILVGVGVLGLLVLLAMSVYAALNFVKSVQTL